MNIHSLSNISSIIDNPDVHVERIIIESELHSKFKKLLLKIHNNFKENDDLKINHFINLLWSFFKKFNISIDKYSFLKEEITNLKNVIYELKSQLNENKLLLDELENILDHILKINVNDKYDAIRKTIIKIQSNAETFAIYTKLNSDKRYSLSDRDINIIKNINHKLKIISNKTELENSNFDVLIIPSTLFTIHKYNEEIIYKILYGGIARTLILINYSSEKFLSINKPTLEVSKPFVKSETIPYQAEINDEDKDEFIYSNQYSEQLDKLFEIDDHNDDKTHETAKGYFVMFSNGTFTLIPVDGSSICLTDYFNKEDLDKDLPSIKNTQIQEDDILLIRTAGSSSDYIEKIADEELFKDNKPGLRNEALNWKKNIQDIINEGNPYEFKKVFENNKGKVSNVDYMQKWLTKEIMSPELEDNFRALILAAFQIRPELYDDPIKYAREKWDKLKELKNYHKKAGFRIREILLSKIKNQKIDASSLDSEKMIKIKDEKGGEIQLLKVSAIESKEYDVPINKFYKVKNL